jgi:hypothetical protein
MFFALVVIYQIVMLILLSDRYVCMDIFPYDLCRDGSRFFIMNILIPFAAFLLFIWRKKIGVWLKKMTEKVMAGVKD